MSPSKKEVREALKFGIKTLILQEVRLLRLERTFTPHFVIEAEFHSVQETKRRIASLVESIEERERRTLLKRMISRTIDEEIDRAIQIRKTTCIRCLHGRFYDEEGTAHLILPTGPHRAHIIGCDKLRPNFRKSCRRFVEMSRADSLDDYLNEMTLLYEFRELINRIEEIWKDYFTK